jgi:hypothetical protein
MPKRSSKQPDFLGALIRTGYLPLEVPPIITSRHFAAYCKKDYVALKPVVATLRKLNTKYCSFSAPRTANSRRVLALVHPVAQLALSLLLTEHRGKIQKIIQRSGASLYSVEEDIPSSKAFVGLKFREWEPKREQIAAECAFILTADISRFFYTAYTHSIPWAVLGKAKAKDWWANQPAKLNAHWSNKLDGALQACQSRETFGIPVGPDTSRIIAEVLLAGVEQDDRFSRATNGRPIFRLMDDFVIGFEEEASARTALTSLRHALWEFNLQLNDQKTGVQPSRHSFREKWKLDFESCPLADADTSAQERDISRLLDVTLHGCAEAGTGQPATWACNRIAKLLRVERNFSLILDTLFRLSREFPACVSHMAEFLINHQGKCSHPAFRARIAKWAKTTIKTHLPQNHDYEVAWALLVCGVLQIKVTEDDMSAAATTPNPAIFAILGMLNERQILDFKLDRWHWKSDFKKTGINSHNWLPFYEAVRRKWTKDKAMVTAVTQHPVFSRMLSADVTFLEDTIFDVSEINITRRVFRKKHSPATGSATSGKNDLQKATNAIIERKTSPISFLTFRRFMRAEFDY